MAQAMGQIARQYTPEFDRVPVGAPNTGANNLNGQFEYADLTASSTAAANGNGDFVYDRNYFRAVIYLKTFTQGTGISFFTIDVADNAAFSTNLRTIAVQPIPFTAGAYCVVLAGACPDGGKRYGRVGFIAGAGASGTFDAFLGACP